jgi:hypothetical protein
MSNTSNGAGQPYPHGFAPEDADRLSESYRPVWEQDGSGGGNHDSPESKQMSSNGAAAMSVSADPVAPPKSAGVVVDNGPTIIVDEPIVLTAKQRADIAARSAPTMKISLNGPIPNPYEDQEDEKQRDTIPPQARASEPMVFGGPSAVNARMVVIGLLALAGIIGVVAIVRNTFRAPQVIQPANMEAAATPTKEKENEKTVPAATAEKQPEPPSTVEEPAKTAKVVTPKAKTTETPTAPLLDTSATKPKKPMKLKPVNTGSKQGIVRDVPF